MADSNSVPPRVRRRRFDAETVERFVEQFLIESSDLTVKSWDRWAKASGAPTNSGVARHVGGGTFSEAITRLARLKGSPTKLFIWPICPNGLRHQTEEYFVGTPVAHAGGSCPVCARQAARREAWREAQPTFAELYPHLLPFLVDPSESDSKAQLVEFRCYRCGHTPIKWSPKWEGLPVCAHCRVTQGMPAGSIVRRRGGGVAVRLEAELAAALILADVPATSGFGVVLQPNRYHVGIAKPDVLLVGEAVAVEIDNHPRPANRHHTSEGLEDDRLRDELLNAAGWAVLRIRRPDAPVEHEWPWRIETTSQAPGLLAKHVIRALGDRRGL